MAMGGTPAERPAEPACVAQAAPGGSKAGISLITSSSNPLRLTAKKHVGTWNISVSS
ncbi:TPA: hypothetical protein ACH3X2_006729 [Trebouxia sp. C0005]